MSQLKTLIQKLSSPIPQIQIRSLNNIYMKITHNIVIEQNLLQFPQLPGLLLSWINDNKKKSDILLKVLYILQQYIKFDQGIILLRQYQCLQFCEEFKIYLVQNERGIEAYLQALQDIIKKMLPLGRANQYIQNNNQNLSANLQQQSKQQNTTKNKQSTSKQQGKKKQSKNIPQTFTFTTISLPLQQTSDKIIFQLFMKLKYANKDTIYFTLCQIRTFTINFIYNSYRSKSDLVMYLFQLSLANVFPQLCLQVVSIILTGIFQTQKSLSSSTKNTIVTLMYQKTNKIQTTQMQLKLPLKIFQIPASFIILQKLTQYAAQDKQRKVITNRYLLAIQYRASIQYYVRILKILKQKQIMQNQQVCLPVIQRYCSMYPSKAEQIINVVPQKIWRKTKILHQFAQKQQKNNGFSFIQSYISQQFSVTKNLHLMRQIIDNLKNGLKGIELQPKSSASLYLQFLATLAISASKQDPIMSYYPEAQDLIFQISKHKNKQIVISFYKQLYQSLRNTKSIINYPGLTVKKFQVVQVLFTSSQFVKNIFRNALDIAQSLTIMLNIFMYFLQRDKCKMMQGYVPLLFALCGHPNQTISQLANKIIQKMPKNYAILCIAIKLFSANPDTRKKLLQDFSNQTSKSQLQQDIVQKISLGYYSNKKKQLKISKSSIQNYLNIILNPSLQFEIRQTAITQFIDCIERIDSSALQDMEDAQLCLKQQIKKYNKKQKLDLLEQKFIILYLKLWQKLGMKTQCFTVQFLIGFLCKINNNNCKATILTVVYLKLLQSPFTNEPYTKNYCMIYFPHIEVVKMAIEHPLQSQQISTIKSNEPIKQNTTVLPYKCNNNFDVLYYSIINSISAQSDFPSQNIQLLQQLLISSITTTNISNISKISFLLNCYLTKNKTNSSILYKQTYKIIVQYIRTNAIAIDLGQDLSRIIRCYNLPDKDNNNISIGTSKIMNYNGWLCLMLVGYHNKILANQQIQMVMKSIDDSLCKSKLFLFLLRQNNIKFSTLNEYNSLKLIQHLITTIRSTSHTHPIRLISLSLLNKLIINQYRLYDNLATIQTLLHTVLLQSKVNVGEFCMILSCYSQILTYENKKNNKNKSQDITGVGNRMGETVVQQICGFIGNMNSTKKNLEDGDNQQSYVILAACYSFLNQLLHSEITTDKNNAQYSKIIYNQSNNIPIIACLTLPKSYTQSCKQKQLLILIPQIVTFLHLYSFVNQDIISALLSSTDIIQNMLNLIVQISSNQNIKLMKKIQILQTIGRLMYTLAKKQDQYIFKINKILRNNNDTTNSQYKLHYILMSSLPIYNQYQRNKVYKLPKHPYNYIKMILWIFGIYKQTTNILQQNDFIEGLLSYCLQIRQFQILAPLLNKSLIAQKIVASDSFVNEKFKQWNKAVLEILWEKSNKGKKDKGDKSQRFEKNSHEENRNKIRDGLIFGATLFSLMENNQDQQDASQAYRQTLASCLKFVDQVYNLLEIQADQNIYKLWFKLLINICRNPLTAKPLSSFISQTIFQTPSKLLQKLNFNSPQTLQSHSSELELLGQISCNQTVRSMIVKHRVIEHSLNILVSMDENKVSKINYGAVYCIVGWLGWLTGFKDTNVKIQNQKKAIDIWAKIIGMQQSEVVQQKILQVLINLSAFKHSKPFFMSSRQIHKVCLGLLSDAEYSQKQKVLCLIYNILYKNAAGIKLYKKKQVLQLLEKLQQVQELKMMSQAVMQILNGNE